jgi:hypothetical protein
MALQEVLQRAERYAGDEGLVRPSTAVPSALRPHSPGRLGVGPPVPPEILSYAQQYTGTSVDHSRTGVQQPQVPLKQLPSTARPQSNLSSHKVPLP